MIQQISLKKGNKADLPSRAPVGEPLFCLDTGELYIGMGEGIKPQPVTNKELSSQLDTNMKELNNIQNVFGGLKMISPNGDVWYLCVDNYGQLGVIKEEYK